MNHRSGFQILTQNTNRNVTCLLHSNRNNLVHHNSIKNFYEPHKRNVASPGENTTLTYGWRPTHTGYYNLTAVADCDGEVSESNEDDNSLVVSEFPVALIGDVNGDGVVGIVDAVIVSLAWASHPGDPNWNLRADLNHDGTINIGDGVRISVHWAKTW